MPYLESISEYSGHEREWAIIKERFSQVYGAISELLRTQWLFGMIDDVGSVQSYYDLF